MCYATYEYYGQAYGGTALTEQDFLKYAKRASAEIDHVTFGRLSNLTDEQIPDAVRDAMCAVAEQLQHDAATANGSIASENNDKYSVSYRDVGDADQRKHAIFVTIRTYLAVTGLMYRGVSENHDLC